MTKLTYRPRAILFPSLRRVRRAADFLSKAFMFSLDIFIFGLLFYALANFLWELWVYQALMNSIWISLSLEQRALENINFGFMDLKVILTAGILLLWIRVWRYRT